MTAPRDDWDEDERAALDGLRDELLALRARHANDPPLELLRAAGSDALPPELQASVSRHLSESAWSRALVEGLEDAGESLEHGAQERLLARVKKEARQPSGWGTSRRWLPPAFVGAALAASVIAGFWLNRPGPDPPTSTPPRAVVADLASPAPLFQLPLEKPDVKLSVAALTWRGAAGGKGLLADLEPALEAYGRSDYAAAERAFAGLSSRYPRSVEVLFYQGVTRLFLNDASGALAALSAAERVADRSFAPDVAWYRALAEQRVGNTREARARLDSLCRGTSPRASRACEAVKQLDSAAASPRSR